MSQTATIDANSDGTYNLTVTYLIEVKTLEILDEYVESTIEYFSSNQADLGLTIVDVDIEANEGD